MKTLCVMLTLCMLMLLHVQCADNQSKTESTTPVRPDNCIGQIPFTLDRGRVIIPMTIGTSGPLKIILDTGMGFDGLYMFHKELQDALAAESIREVIVPGAGDSEPSKAIQADSVDVTAGDMTFANQMLIISQSEYTQTFSTDGVTGWTLFGHYVLEIDYENEMINLYESGAFMPGNDYHAVELTLKNNIPHFSGLLNINGNNEIDARFYIDLASGEALELLTGPNMKFALPDNLGAEVYQGTGLSGDIHGRYGRVKSLTIGAYTLHDVYTAFVPAEVRTRQDNADGVIANRALTRFHVVFDYADSTMYLKPNSMFDKPFDEIQSP